MEMKEICDKCGEEMFEVQKPEAGEPARMLSLELGMPVGILQFPIKMCSQGHFKGQALVKIDTDGWTVNVRTGRND